MKWVLVWWIIHPHHAQVMHIQMMESEQECHQAVEQLQETGKPVRARCSPQ